MANPTETIEVQFPSTTPDESEQRVEQIKDEGERIVHLKKSQKELSDIQKHLSGLIDAMAHNPSMLSRASTFWGNRPLWQKIVAGVVLVAPTLVLGIVAHIITLIAISVFTLLTYVGGSVILDDHHTHNQNATKNIKTGVLSLAEGLEVIMESLKTIGDSLAEQITLFEKENVHFAEQIDSLANRNLSLTEEINKLKETELRLRDTVLGLEETCGTLKNSVQEQSELLTANQQALSKARVDFVRTQEELQAKVTELTEVNKQFTTEVERQKKTTVLLKAALDTFTESMMEDDKQKETFHEKLDAFLTDKEEIFSKLSERISITEEELTVVKQQLKEATDRCAQLVSQASDHVTRLEKIKLAPATPSSVSKLGIYAQGAGKANLVPQEEHSTALVM